MAPSLMSYLTSLDMLTKWLDHAHMTNENDDYAKHTHYVANIGNKLVLGTLLHSYSI